MAGVGASTSNISSGTSATSDDDHDSDVLMANNTISVCINERHKTYMQACRADGICFGKFKDVETHILEVDPQPLFSNIHINENGVCIPSVPLTKKWSEFLFDLWNWCTHELFEENYVTQMDVNRCGCGKLYAAWRIMDKYRGRYQRQNLTRNVVDVQITIPDCNLFISYHFCYKYFRTSKGSPYTLLPDMLKPIMIRLYDKYFIDMTLSNVSTRVHFTCAYCDHNEDEGPEKKHTQMIPKWYMKQLYSTTQCVSKFSLFWTVNVLFEAEISCC